VIKVICPATETHIRKYSPQHSLMVRETPEIYRDVVVPYIESFDASRLSWCVDTGVILLNMLTHSFRVYQILAHEKEADRIVFEDPDPERGFIILPDLKWDQTSLSALVSDSLLPVYHLLGLKPTCSTLRPLFTRGRSGPFVI
jgi:m7GpppX diphosphatase